MSETAWAVIIILATIMVLGFIGIAWFMIKFMWDYIQECYDELTRMD